MATNRTFTMIKPEAVANGDSGKIIDMIIEAGFKVKAMKLTTLSKERAGEFADALKIDFIALKKHRDRKTGKINIITTKASVKDRDLVLVDDMISTGGSIIKATQFLKKQKCRRIYVACTHGLFVNGAEKKIKQAGVTQIISTNTIPTNSSKVDVSRMLAESLL